MKEEDSEGLASGVKSSRSSLATLPESSQLFLTHNSDGHVDVLDELAVVRSSSVDPHVLSFKSAPVSHKRFFFYFLFRYMGREVLQDVFGILDSLPFNMENRWSERSPGGASERAVVSSRSEDDGLLPYLSRSLKLISSLSAFRCCFRIC